MQSNRGCTQVCFAMAAISLTSLRHIGFRAIRVLFQSMGRIAPSLFARWGIWLWGKSHRLPWRPWEITILDQSTREVLDIADEKVCVYTWGKGQHTILLAHGWNSRASHFKNYIERLSATGYRVIAFDAIGHGHSSGHWTSVVGYQAVMKAVHESYGPFHTIIGHSFGGFCIPYALNHNFKCDKAVLLATPDTLRWLFDRFIGILQAPKPVIKAMERLVEKRFGKDCWEVYSVPPNASQLGSVPALIVHDQHDPGVPLELAQINHQAWPRSRLIITRKLGHHRVLRHPSAITPVIEFIQEN